MAEFVMKRLVEEAGVADRFEIESAALHTDEIGNGVYPPARRELARHGITECPHRARLMTRADYDRCDLIVGMDDENAFDLRRLTNGDPQGKCRQLMSFAGIDREVADPWYTGDFESTWNDVLAGCRGILRTAAAAP